jgi:hypothetical protein
MEDTEEKLKTEGETEMFDHLAKKKSAEAHADYLKSIAKKYAAEDIFRDIFFWVLVCAFLFPVIQGTRLYYMKREFREKIGQSLLHKVDQDVKKIQEQRKESKADSALYNSQTLPHISNKINNSKDNGNTNTRVSSYKLRPQY